MSGFFNNFAVDGLTIIGNKIVESSNNLKTVENNHNLTHNIYFTGHLNSIIMVSSVLFGSIYLSSISLRGLNDLMIHEKKENHRYWVPFLCMNGSILLGSTCVYVVCTSYLLYR